jgi:hypothetical protein
MLERIDELEQQIDSFMREFFGSIRSEVRGLAPLEDIDAAAAGAQQPEPEREAEPEPRPEPESVEAEPEREEPQRPFEEPGADEEPEEEAEEPRRRRGFWGRREREDDASEGAEAESASAESSEDAHVMALNMALNGTPRDETESYLVQRFGSFGGLESILDDVYGRIKPS